MLTATAVLIIFWSIPVAFVGILSNLTYLTNKLTFLKFIYNLPNAILGLITGLLPSVLLSVLMALLPIVLTFFAKQFKSQQLMLLIVMFQDLILYFKLFMHFFL